MLSVKLVESVLGALTVSLYKRILNLQLNFSIAMPYVLKDLLRSPYRPYRQISLCSSRETLSDRELRRNEVGTF